MMILKFLVAVFAFYVLFSSIFELIGIILQMLRKKARHKETTIPVRDASAPVEGNSVQRNRTSSAQNRTLSVQARTSSVATGQRGQRAGRQAPPPVPRQNYKKNRPPRRMVRNGSGGLKASLFPCCPICRMKNFAGEPQKIFWHEQGQFYECKNSHKFKKNGSLF